MKTCADYLDELHRKHGWTDYRIAKTLGLTPQSVYAYRNGTSSFSKDTAYHVARLLELDPFEVWMAAEYERDNSSPMAAEIKKRFPGLFSTAATLLMALITFPYQLIESGAMYIM